MSMSTRVERARPSSPLESRPLESHSPEARVHESRPLECRRTARRARRPVLLALCVAALAACSDTTGPETGAVENSAAPSNAQGSAATNIQFGDFALHVPANVHHIRGILVALGGPDTRGFAVGSPFGAPPSVETALQELGGMFRALAAERGLAILGSGRFGPRAYPNDAASDQLLLDAIAQAADLTGRRELVNAPILMYGVSGGGPEAAGFTQRNPDRVVGLFLKVPQSAGPLTGAALHVPAFMVLAEQDAFIDNTILSATFAMHRNAGAPWAMAMEPGVPHHSLSPAQRELTVDWMRVILAVGHAPPIRQSLPRLGWLGDPATGRIAPTSRFDGDPSTASWLPTRSVAAQWSAFIGW